MAVVERCQFVLTKTLYSRKNQTVDKADICVGVPVHQLTRSYIVGPIHLIQMKRAALKIVKECQCDSDIETLGNPVIDLWKRWLRNYKVLIAPVNKFAASWVIGVRSVHVGIDHAGVEHQSQGSTGRDAAARSFPPGVRMAAIGYRPHPGLRSGSAQPHLQALSNELGHGYPFFCGSNTGSFQELRFSLNGGAPHSHHDSR